MWERKEWLEMKKRMAWNQYRNRQASHVTCRSFSLHAHALIKSLLIIFISVLMKIIYSLIEISIFIFNSELFFNLKYISHGGGTLVTYSF